MNHLPKKELESLTRRLRTKADKIRALVRAGVPPSEIARFLGVRYQYAYNVLKQSMRHDAVMDAAASPSRMAKVAVDSFGRIPIPEHLRSALGVAAGDELLITLEGEELRLFTPAAGLRVAQSIVGKYLRPGDSLSAELLDDRASEVGSEHD
jgi:bifunctional DNA-binding transcriptional regulator/antitoxin component of YhaV-PrlF toxin-antitoxin module